MCPQGHVLLTPSSLDSYWERVLRAPALKGGKIASWRLNRGSGSRESWRLDGWTTRRQRQVPAAPLAPSRFKRGGDTGLDCLCLVPARMWPCGCGGRRVRPGTDVHRLSDSAFQQGNPCFSPEGRSALRSLPQMLKWYIHTGFVCFSSEIVL